MPYNENENPLERLIAFLQFLRRLVASLLFVLVSLLLVVFFVAWLLRLMQV